MDVLGIVFFVFFLIKKNHILFIWKASRITRKVKAKKKKVLLPYTDLELKTPSYENQFFFSTERKFSLNHRFANSFVFYSPRIKALVLFFFFSSRIREIEGFSLITKKKKNEKSFSLRKISYFSVLLS